MTPSWTARDLVEATGGAMATDVRRHRRVDRHPHPARRAICSWRCAARPATATTSSPTRWPGAPPGRWCIATCPRRRPTRRCCASTTRWRRCTRLGGSPARASPAGWSPSPAASARPPPRRCCARILAAFGPTHAARRLLQQPLGRAADAGARCRRTRAFCVVEIGMNHAGEIAPLARLARAACRGHHHDREGACRPSRPHRGDRRREGVDPARAGAGRHRRAAGRHPPLLPRLRGARRREARRASTSAPTPAADARLLDAEADADGTDVVAAIDGTEARLPARRAGPAHGDERAGRAGRRRCALRRRRCACRGRRAGRLRAGRRARRAARDRGAARRGAGAAGGTALLLDESYNGNGASMRAALAVLRLQPARRRVAVLGDMLELGDDGPAEHRALADRCRAAADLLFACGPLMRHLFDARAANDARARTRPTPRRWRRIVARRGARRATRSWSRAASAAA